MGALRPQHQLFVEHYFALDMDGAKAAVAAGFSERSARQIASRLLTRDDVAAEVKRRLDARAVTADEALSFLGELMRIDVDDVLTVPGTFPYVDLEKARRLGKTRFIKKVKVRGDGGIEVELYNAQRANETVLRHHGLLKDGHTFNISIELIVQTVDALTKAGIDVQEFFEKAKQRAEQLGLIQPG